MQERQILEENYRFLRKIEHRLQIMFDLKTHTLPDNDKELRRLAIRTGYSDHEGHRALDEFKRDLRENTQLNRKILDHLLHDAFGEDPGGGPRNRSGPGPASPVLRRSRRACSAIIFAT